MLTSDKCYSTVIQETEAEAALIEVGEEMFNDHLINSTRELSKKKEVLRALFRDGDISPTDKENALNWKKISKISSKRSLQKAAILQKVSKIALQPLLLVRSSKTRKKWVQLSPKANCELQLLQIYTIKTILCLATVNKKQIFWGIFWD